jgi:hypothetical protein
LEVKQLAGLLFISTFIWCSLNAQLPTGGFTPGTGGAILSGNFEFVNYKQVQIAYDTTRRGHLLRSVQDYTFRIYAEYGATENLTIIASAPIKVSSTANEFNEESDFADTLQSGNLSGISNVEIGVKYRFKIRQKWDLSATLLTELKTASFDQTTGLRTGYDAWSFYPAVYFGRQYFDERLYFFVHGGSSLRTDSYSSDLRFGAEAGYKAFKVLWLRVLVNARRSLRNGQFSNPNNLQTAMHVNDQEWVRIGAQVGYEHKIGVGLFLQANFNFAGNQIPVNPIYNAGIYYRIKSEKDKETKGN